MRCELLNVNSPQWDEVLRRVPHDFYHTSAYHRFETGNGEGDAFAFVAESDSGSVVVWPYLLKKANIPGYGEHAVATEVRSAYGYPGPVFTPGTDNEFVHASLAALTEVWLDQKVVSAFTRLHPVLESHAPLAALDQVGGLQRWRPAHGGECLVCHGQTVSIDLRQDPEVRMANYSATLRKGIRRNLRAGATTVRDADFSMLEHFYRFYVATMERNRASDYYYFPLSYFERLVSHAPGVVHLFVTSFGADVACAALISEYAGQLQALFIMGNPDFEDKAPSRTMIHDVCQWGTERGAVDFHLGGGRGGVEDSLFRFKAQFSDVHRDFYTFRAVTDQKTYAELSQLRTSVSPVAEEDSFFPLWRKPVIPAAPPAAFVSANAG